MIHEIIILHLTVAGFIHHSAIHLSYSSDLSGASSRNASERSARMSLLGRTYHQNELINII